MRSSRCTWPAHAVVSASWSADEPLRRVADRIDATATKDNDSSNNFVGLSAHPHAERRADLAAVRAYTGDAGDAVDSGAVDWSSRPPLVGVMAKQSDGSPELLRLRRFELLINEVLPNPVQTTKNSVCTGQLRPSAVLTSSVCATAWWLVAHACRAFSSFPLPVRWRQPTPAAVRTYHQCISSSCNACWASGQAGQSCRTVVSIPSLFDIEGWN